jgi:periplasmic divalent cation tolerance protein
MKEEKSILLVLVTAPDKDTARKIALPILEKRLAACVNILPGLISLYHWENEIQEDQEVQLFIKTRQDLLEDKLIPLIKELHPYKIPEILAFPISGGSKPYLDWVVSETEKESTHNS